MLTEIRNILGGLVLLVVLIIALVAQLRLTAGAFSSYSQAVRHTANDPIQIVNPRATLFSVP